MNKFLIFRKLTLGAPVEIQRRKQQRYMETASTNSGAEGTSLNQFRMLKYFKSKWYRFWIISLNIRANIAVTKHVLLADEFIPYRPRLLGFHSLHVNALKCIYVGFSLSKLLSFFWEVFLNSRLIRLEGLIIKFRFDFLCVPRGFNHNGASKVLSSILGITFFSSLLFFSFLLFFFFCLFSFHFRSNIFVMFLYIPYNF